ncbi:MAG: ATP phosphoribosyltransferase regulatory subunit, partial [Gammaproteobacteria bacterium]|nr:ATP phosphoribosyltransferase regulatory subunit [Gammaproteobacteria bacterium]
MKHQNWRLPDGVDELLPPAAWALERIRRTVLDVFHVWGFDYVEPPLIEYLDALLVGSGNDLDLQTLKVVDQRSGRMLGMRADMTSQAARIDAHSLQTNEVQRLCYAGTVVHANPQAVLASRVPVKAGAEIFGSTSLAADAEVVALLVEVL